MSTPLNPLERIGVSELVAEIERRITWRGPKVSREFVKKLVDYIQDKYVGSYDDIDEYAELDIEITRLFTGAGIEVEE